MTHFNQAIEPIQELFAKNHAEMNTIVKAMVKEWKEAGVRSDTAKPQDGINLDRKGFAYASGLTQGDDGNYAKRWRLNTSGIIAGKRRASTLPSLTKTRFCLKVLLLIPPLKPHKATKDHSPKPEIIPLALRRKKINSKRAAPD
jgi:hypothetical protein